jgi:hypothetical protein
MTSIFNRNLQSIGFLISSGSDAADSTNVDIERTILDAVKELPRDGRLASLLLSWVKVHGEFVIVEKLRKLANQLEMSEPGATTWLGAVAAFSVREGDSRWRILLHRPKAPVYLLPKEVAETAIAMKGAEDWLKTYNYLVPVGSLRIRVQDVLAPRDLLRINRQYRNRYIYGPSWRADIATAVDDGLRTPADIARAVGCSYEPAYRVFHQLALARNLPEGAGAP